MLLSVDAVGIRTSRFALDPFGQPVDSGDGQSGHAGLQSDSKVLEWAESSVTQSSVPTMNLAWHELKRGADDESLVTLIGCFSSASRAHDELAAAMALPGFAGGRVWVETRELDRVDPHWLQGFFSWR